MTTDQSPRFTPEELKGCQSWLLPDIDSSNLIHSADREEKEKKKKNQKKNEQGIHLDDGELIEPYEETVEPLTAEQLQEITEAAEKEGYSSGYDKGFQKGVEKGNEEGKKQGLEETKETISKQCQNLQQVIDALMIPLDIEHKEIQQTLVDMVCTLTQAVIQRELQLDTSNLVTLVDRAIASLPQSTGKFILYLNPSDIELVESHIQRSLEGRDQEVLIQEDESLMSGGCRLETKNGLVDYSVEQRMEKVIDDFLHKRYTNDETEPRDSADKPIFKPNAPDDS